MLLVGISIILLSVASLCLLCLINIINRELQATIKKVDYLDMELRAERITRRMTEETLYEK